jgi:hypothetical protein
MHEGFGTIGADHTAAISGDGNPLSLPPKILVRKETISGAVEVNKNVRVPETSGRYSPESSEKGSSEKGTFLFLRAKK